MKQYSAKYFGRTSKIIKENIPSRIITLQFFQRADHVVLCGMNEVLEILKKETDTSKYSIKYLEEGSLVNAGEVVLELEGPYYEFGEFEGIIDGILVRQSSIATNARLAKEAAGAKQVIFMGDRADHYSNQTRDGYAAAIGGVTTQVTDAQVKLHSGNAVGTMPHALIQAFGGDLIAALHAYKKSFPNEKLAALVDFHNDVITDAVKAVKEFGQDLASIRIDTSGNMVDAMFKDVKEYGVTVNMVKNVRKAMDEAGGQHVKIVVSSGFTPKKIKEFEDAKAPVDIYGIGGALLQINLNFTADAVKVDNKLVAKAGRGYKEMKNYKVYKQSQS